MYTAFSINVTNDEIRMLHTTRITLQNLRYGCGSFSNLVPLVLFITFLYYVMLYDCSLCSSPA